MTVPASAAGRLSSGVKRFAPILSAAKARNVNESDTLMIVADILADVFGYDCDGSGPSDDGFQMLLEIKAIGLRLEESHVRQAVDYASNRGIEWVTLTNGHRWQVFRVIFAKPVRADLVLDIDFLTLNPKSKGNLESLYLLTRESMLKSGLYAHHDHLQAQGARKKVARPAGSPVASHRRASNPHH